MRNPRHRDTERVLDLWSIGRTAPEIVTETTLETVGMVNWIIYSARQRGDERAYRRPQGRFAEYVATPDLPLFAPDLGIEAVTRHVNSVPSDSTSSYRIPVSVARVRCLEDVG